MENIISIGKLISSGNEIKQNKNTTPSEQIQNPIENHRKRQDLTHKYMTAHFLGLAWTFQ